MDGMKTNFLVCEEAKKPKIAHEGAQRGSVAGEVMNDNNAPTLGINIALRVCFAGRWGGVVGEIVVFIEIILIDVGVKGTEEWDFCYEHVETIAIFERDFNLIPIDGHVFGDDAQNLALHLLHFFGGDINAVMNQHKLQPLFGGAAAAFAAATPKQSL
jgi:hypothetical protein